MLAVIRNYDGFVEALRARQAELGVTNEKIDELSGLPSGYTGKLLGASQVKSIGPLAFGLLLETLGLELVARVDEATTQKMAGRWEKRERPAIRTEQPRTKAKNKRFPSIVFRVMGQRSAAIRMDTTTPEQRSRLASRAGRARWKGLPKAQRAEAARRAVNARWAKRRKDKERER